MKCPICHSHKIETRSIGKTTGAILGGIMAIGALNTDFNDDESMESTVADISKTILAGVTGALVGADLGAKLDGAVFADCKCADCGYTFTARTSESSEMPNEILFLEESNA